MSAPNGFEDPYRLWDAAYVLGALPPAERRDYEDHVAGCEACRRQLAGLAGLPGLLGRLNVADDGGEVDDAPVADGQDVVPAGPTAAGGIAPYAAFAVRVRRRRVWLAAAAAAVVLATATGTAAVTARLEAPAPPVAATQSPAPGVPLRFAGPGGGLLTAEGALHTEPWGTTVTWTCRYAGVVPGQPETRYPGATSSEAPGRYELVVYPVGGGSLTLATWQAGPGSTVSPTATTSLAVPQIRALAIRAAGSRANLLTATP